MKNNARYIAVKVLTHVLQHHQSLSDSLDTHLPTLTDKRERALAQELSYGVMRWLPRLQAILKQLLRKPFKQKDLDIEALLLIGLYQQIYLRIPPHAAISATVEVTRLLQKNWATQLSNGVLRNFQRNSVELLQQIDKNDTVRYAHPKWMLKRLKQDWPEDWQAIAEANNQRPPMSLRVNLRKTSRDDYLKLLETQQIDAAASPHIDSGIQLEKPIDVQLLPNFSDGWVSVQDNAAQLAAHLLNVPQQATVLDACAAPGGKTAHLLERYDMDTLIAIDNQQSRIGQIHDTLQRLGLAAKVVCADASQPDNWWDKKQFDRILLDVPCSASGVIRRHPDIKYLRQPSDLATLVKRQAEILRASWGLLKPNGQLLYATCSVFKQENDLQVQDFIAQHPDAKALTLPDTWGHAQTIGRQILPCDKECFDGFYYACLLKTS
ncbi:16S rRNA (cytosine(967)-C(5))-methyltransferase RsmB [Candidatus Albibeggiatoa sp. nov. NOAA]|uniref:16S rRNA (cytosine(967)-C(5))-methyltransferase RsmB n=1 Tax=Candidatus Albibeggiatoa sp. nov. NOAA TaxID=3162724 RepID=UPI0032FA2EB4|nr:16S rRNA (cytosine(967)-C(5))-methyltransferase RsmB [Thiotrichaceae bacterium]